LYEIFLATPFDVVKTRLQSQSIFKGSSLNSKLHPTLTACSEVFFSAHNLRREFLCHLDLSHTSSNQASTLSCTVTDAATLAPSRQIAASRHFNGSLVNCWLYL
jgi:hypothetical protein